VYDSGFFISGAASGADVRGQQDVPKPVDIEMVEVILRKVELEPASEVADAPF
jgi:hypothetical protein